MVSSASFFLQIDIKLECRYRSVVAKPLWMHLHRKETFLSRHPVETGTLSNAGWERDELIPRMKPMVWERGIYLGSSEVVTQYSHFSGLSCYVGGRLRALIRTWHHLLPLLEARP